MCAYCTVKFKVQFCPAMVKAKFAVPAAAGVPVIIYVTVLEPVAKFPANKVAVNPATPVEATVCPEKVPPLPPVYDKSALTVEAAIALVSVPTFTTPAQSKEVIVPIVVFGVAQQFQQELQTPFSRLRKQFNELS